VDERAIQELRGLERRDAELSERVERFHRLASDVAAIRARAEAIDAFFAGYPEAEDRARRVLEAAESELADRRVAVESAQTAVANARDDEGRAAAERALARAADSLAVAEGRVSRAVAERDELERDAAALPADLPTLAGRAREIAAELAAEAPDDAPRELVEWAAHAQATLFVAAGQLDTQRDRVIREANELATMLIGEPTYGATPAQARARVEATLR
jgi:DNA repair exonuclease SbcCD ATPase subunit